MRRVLITLLPVFAALLACGYSSEDDNMPRAGAGGAGGSGGGSSGEPVNVSIDTGAALTTEPGQGIGVLLDYEAGGKWHVQVACDTALSTDECYWDIVVETMDGATVRNVSTEGFESTDSYDWDNRGARSATFTGNDNDGLVIQTDPGAPLLVDVLLDGEPANAFVYWISNDGMNRGAPSNPVILTPSAP